MNEWKSHKEPQLDCKQFPCSLVLKGLSWTFFWDLYGVGFLGCVVFKEQFYLKYLTKNAYLLKEQRSKSSQGGFSTPWLRLKLGSHLLTFWKHLEYSVQNFRQKIRQTLYEENFRFQFIYVRAQLVKGLLQLIHFPIYKSPQTVSKVSQNQKNSLSSALFLPYSWWLVI